MSLMRRDVLAALALAPLGACVDRPDVTGGFAGPDAARGHAWRDRREWPAPSVVHRVHTVIAGGGVAGLAASRALRLRGIDDFALLELEDEAGGNSRGAMLGGLACPLGAHYLPVPGEGAGPLLDFLEECGLRTRVAGRWTYDERNLCHAPQERLFFRGAWQEGLLPTQDVPAATLDAYRRFASRVSQAHAQARFSMPAPVVSPAAHLRLDAIPFDAWLAREGLADEHLRWYLDYSCRDDYGAGLGAVSAWAGLHYFASRHGFQPPGTETGERDAVLTWPEGNAWLARRLASPLGERLHTARTVLRVEEQALGVVVDAWNARTQAVERWEARHAVVALPVFIASRVVASPPAPLAALARGARYAPWIVANLRLREPLRDGTGAPPAWDNVVYGAASVGYVDAGHQRLDPTPGPTVLSWYLAPGEPQRGAVLDRGWRDWYEVATAELAAPHPDLRDKVMQVQVARYGHAMAIPAPGALALRVQGRPDSARLSFAHADWAGYSVFEEAFAAGHRAGSRAA